MQQINLKRNTISIPLQFKRRPFFKGKNEEYNKDSFFAPVTNTGRSSSLPSNVLSKMENSFGSDFTEVRIHKNDKSADKLHARAYTQGNDIHFGSGSFNPNTQSGQELIGHELAHVVQQRKGAVRATHSEHGMAVNNSHHLEHEANIQGRIAANGGVVSKNENTMTSSVGNELVQMNATEERIWYNEHPTPQALSSARRLILWNYPIEGTDLSIPHRAQLERFLNPSSLIWLSGRTYIQVVGRASNSGELGDNLALSEERARNVVPAIHQIMAPRRRRVQIFGYGVNSPIRSNSTPRGMAHNRSVEIRIIVPGPRPVPERDTKWAYAKQYLEQITGCSFQGNADQIWTPTNTCLLRMIPAIPSILGGQPAHYGDAVPSAIGTQRPSSQYMPSPNWQTHQTLGRMLTREFRLNTTLTNRQIEMVVHRFVTQAREANDTRVRRLTHLMAQASQGGGAMIERDLGRYQRAERVYFRNDPFCAMRCYM